MSDEQVRTALVELERVVTETGIGPETMQELDRAFGGIFAQLDDWKRRAEEIVVTDESQIEMMTRARGMRLALRDVRLEIERRRKELKAESLRKGKAIDGVANVLKFIIEPLEEHLLEQEQFAERQAAARKAALTADRIDRIRPYVTPEELISMKEVNLADMTEETYAAFLEGLQRKHAEAQERQRRQAEEQEKKARAEAEARKRLEAENKRLAEQVAKERAARIEAERKKKEDERERKRIAEAPDREKLEAYAKELTEVPMPKCQTSIGQELAERFRAQVTDLARVICAEAKALPR